MLKLEKFKYHQLACSQFGFKTTRIIVERNEPRYRLNHRLYKETNFLFVFRKSENLEC